MIDILDVPTSSCAQMYNHAHKNTAEMLFSQTEATSNMLAAEYCSKLVAEFEREARDTKCDIFLAVIDAQHDSLYAVPEVQTVLVESSADKEEEYTLQWELVSMSV